ncbi:MAG: glycyl-radical enzyme activating protein [Clostridiales bacterium]|nr:glycyl-radical enzyme activating protein [Clostridiales bacterium]
MNSLIFDIKEFGLHDGSGLRTTVFFKGCPLRCVWCHNPEGQSFTKEITKNPNKCTHCGLCEKGCNHKECKEAGVCLKICPNDNVKVVGVEYTPMQLAEKLLKNKAFLNMGGVTFSGGEPLCHGDFILETIKYLQNIKTAVETCGYVKTEDFLKVTDKIDEIFMDIKLIDDDEHIRYTGVSNKLILENARKILAKRFVTIRVPLIPSITDTDKNLKGIAEFLLPYKDNVLVELIPYNRMTGAKYKNLGIEYNSEFNENAILNKNTDIFTKKGINAISY